MPGVEGLPPGNQIWADVDVKDSYELFGKSGLKRKDGYDKASGRAVYTRDITLPGMLYAVQLVSPYSAAKITTMDTSIAENYPGVRYILRYDDPEIEGQMLSTARMPVPYLGDRAYYSGQTLGAMVVADTEQIAREALKLIDIQWEIFDFVTDPTEASEAGAPVVNPDRESNSFPSPKFVLGDVTAGFAQADGTVEFSAKKAMISGGGAEPVSCIVKWDGQGKLESWQHNQTPGQKRVSFSARFNIPTTDVNTNVPYQGHMGGHFQWVTSVYSGMHILTGIVAKRLGKPVKLVYDRRDDFTAGSAEYIHINEKVGFKNDGTITAVEAVNYGGQTTWYSHEHLWENTKIPNLSIQPYNMSCNVPPVGAMRCEQVNNWLVCNLACDHVARALEMDPTEVALKNDGYLGHDAAWLSEFKREHGFPDVDGLSVTLAKGKQEFDWGNKWHAPGSKTLPNGRKHGVGFAWGHQWQDASGDATMAVGFNQDGSVFIMAQDSDIGVNARSSISTVVAEELGIPYDKVDFLDRGHGTQTFECEPPAGSSAFTCNAYAAKYAARKARASLLNFVTNDFHYSTGFGGSPRITHAKAFFPGKKPEELEIKNDTIFEIANPENKKTIAECTARAGFCGQSAGAQGMAPGIFAWQYISQPARADGDSDCHHMWLGRAAYFVEVEVDTETGETFVTNWTAVNDAGRVISPESFFGQMYGGLPMTWGRAYLEEYVWDTNTGVQMNPDLIDYKLATIKDVLPDTIHMHAVETGLGWGPYGTIGVGELVATCHFTAVGNAIYNALGKSVDDYPVTPAKVLKALGKA